MVFNGDTIVDLAKQAAQLGIDMVVMDDGWFGKRNDDNSSLGDWFVNDDKLGGTLGDLIERVNAQGVKFGIWIEPEMVNEDSDLYREHPDWALTIPGSAPIRSRNQLLLDFSRKEVREEILKRICVILDQGNIEYVKWDMNRSMSDVYAGNVPYDYVLGLYDFLEKLTNRYPDILIEGCSGGGGRFDAGMMYYTPQIWCSDNTDAINRTRIQYGTSFFYPTAVVGSHVSAVPNHQTGRITSLNTRGMTWLWLVPLDLK
ncbi:MAG: alpha-galactosidase [Eubacterium sp.]